MILTIDVGNSQIFGGVFERGELAIRFRKTSRPATSSDELGLFLRNVLRENGGDPTAVEQVALCSVVPEMIYPLRSCHRKYFGIDPFILQAGARTGLKIRYRNPLEVGPDRIANAIGATHLYPGRNLVIVDFGTATTFDVVSSQREYMGGIIVPGLRIAMEALEQNTARLPTVEIMAASEIVGRSTVESIQSGLYFGTRELVAGLTREIRKRTFHGESVWVIGTGGFSRLFERERMFDVLLPDLVLIGLERALAANPDGSRRWTGIAEGQPESGADAQSTALR
jgi:type III pantothenate kinase